MITVKEQGPNVLISPTRYSLEELDNYLQKWKTSGEFNSLPEAESEMINRITVNPELKFRIIAIYPNETEEVSNSADIVNANSLDDPEGNQAI